MPRQKKQKLLGGGLKANLLREFIDLSYKGNTSIAPEGWSIDAPLSDSRVKVYAKNGSNDKNIVIVHRGSVGGQDWWDNAKFLVAGKVKGTKSYKMHRERHLKAVEKYGAENIIGIGHSRGGLYLQELQKEVPIKEIVTYNKAVGFYDALRENPAEQTDVKVKNDFVSLLSGLQKRPKPMVEIDATSNPLDFNKAHQPAEIEKLGDTFIGLKDKIEGGKLTNPFYTPLPIVAVDFVGRKTGLFGSGRAPTPKTLEQLKKTLKTLEGKLEKINKGKVYKTTNKEKVEYELSYTKARIKNHETKGEDLIITKKAKYGNELPAKAKPYKAKEVKPKEVKPKEEPKKEEPKPVLELPTPDPTPKKIEPLINKLETKIKEFEALGKKHGAVIYNAEGFAQAVAYIALLIEYEAKCAIIGGKNLTNYSINSKLDNTMNTFFYSKAEKLSNDLLDCIKRGDKMIAMPLNLHFGDSNMGHANLLIYRPYENTIERFEPYGELPDTGADKTFNIILKKMFEVEMKPYLKELTPKFIEPNQVCPNVKGFQNLEEQLGLLEQEGGGFCAMWSLFILELIFLNPTLSTKEIIQQGLTLSKSKPQYLRNVIRGYVLKIEKMLDSYVKKIGLHDGFNFKTTKNLKNSKIIFQEQLLNLLLSFGGSNSNIKELEESVKLQKLLSTKTNLEINNMAKTIFKYNFGVHAYKKWTNEDMIKFINNTYLIPDTPKYKANYIDEIFKYFEEPKKVGGIFGFSDKEKADKAERKMLKEEYFKTHSKQQNANYNFDKSARDKWKIKFYKKNSAPKADDTAPKADDTAPKADDTAPKADETMEQQGIEEGEQALEGGKFTKEGLAQLSKKELYALNKKYSKAFKGQFSKKHKKIGGGIETFGKMLWSGLSNAPEAVRIQQEASKVLNGVKVWHLPFWKPADHITEQQAKEMVDARAKELGIEALHDKMSREVGFDVRQMNNNKALGLAFSSALDGLSYTPVGLASSVASSVASQVLDPNLKPLEEKDETEKTGSGFYYLDEIVEPTNPVYIARSNEKIPTFVEPETEYLVGGAFTDMAGMNCDKTTGSCFNPVWEKEKIKRQILSEYKIWYNPFAPPPAGTIRMAWLPKMIEERYKPLYDEFVARRNVNIGLPADASKDRFAQQMFSNLTDGLSYVPGSNLATIGLTAASALSDTKKGDGT